MSSMPTIDPAPTLIGVAAAAAILAISEKTLRRRITEGRLKAYRVAGGSAIRVDKADVLQLIEPMPVGGDL